MLQERLFPGVDLGLMPRKAACRGNRWRGILSSTMPKKPHVLDDVIEQIVDLGTMVGEGFDRLDKRIDGIETRMDRLETRMSGVEGSLQELRAWIERIDNRLMGVESDIKEIYDSINRLASKQDRNSDDIRLLKKQMQQMADWMRKVSEQTGVPVPKL